MGDRLQPASACPTRQGVAAAFPSPASEKLSAGL